MNERLRQICRAGHRSGHRPDGRLHCVLHARISEQRYYLGGLMFLQVLLAAVWKYEQRFFPLLVIVFLWAGMSLPFSGVWTFGRWPVLATGSDRGLCALHAERATAVCHLSPDGDFFRIGGAGFRRGFRASDVVLHESAELAASLSVCRNGGTTGSGGARRAIFPETVDVGGDCRLSFGHRLLCLAHSHFWQPEFHGRHYGCGRVPLLFWGVLTVQGKSGSGAWLSL